MEALTTRGLWTGSPPSPGRTRTGERGLDLRGAADDRQSEVHEAAGGLTGNPECTRRQEV